MNHLGCGKISLNKSKQCQYVVSRSLHFAASYHYSIKSLSDVCLLRRTSPLIQQSDRRLLPERPSIYFASAHALLHLWLRVVDDRILQKNCRLSAPKRAVKRYRNNSVVSTGPFPLTRPSHLVLESTDLRNLQRQCKLCIALVLLHVSITMYKYSNVLVFYSASIAMRYYSSVLVFKASLILRCQITLQSQTSQLPNSMILVFIQ